MSAPYSGEDDMLSALRGPSPANLTTSTGPGLRSPARSKSYQLSPARMDPSSRQLLKFKNSARQSVFDVSSIDGSTHSYGIDEMGFFANYINLELGKTANIQHRLPVNDDNLLEACSDGILLCYLVNHVEPGAISEKRIHRQEPLSVFQKASNCNIALDALKGLGSNIVNIGATDITEAKPVLVLALLWQIVRTNIVARISITACPQLKLLKNKGESDSSFAALPVEQILMRWFNHQLKWSGCSRTINNFDKDLADGHCYMELLHRLGRGQIGSNILAKKKYSAPQEIASHVIKAASSDLDVQALIQPHHILEGNSRLNMAFVAQLFNASPDIVDTTKCEKSISSFQTLFRRNSCHKLNPESEDESQYTENLKPVPTNLVKGSNLRTEYGTLTKSKANTTSFVQPSQSMYRHLIPGNKGSKSGKKVGFMLDSPKAGGLEREDKGGETVYQKVRDTLDEYHEKYYTPISELVSDWSKRNPTIVMVAEKAVKPVTVVSLLSVLQMVFQVSREMSLAGAL